MLWLLSFIIEHSSKAMESNQMKMREALDRIGNIAGFVAENCGDQQTAKYMNDIISEVQSAIATPPRNCDVGTAKEQWKRFDEFCISWEESGPNGGCSDECPCMAIKSKESDGCFGQSGCFSIWAQMPYEEEGRAEK